jgi:Fe-S-cluster containining protein
MKPLPLVHGPPALTDAEAAAMQRAAQAVRRQAVANMAQRPREEAVVQQTIWLHQATDAEMASAQADGLKVACQPGCKHCCAARVEALAPEVFLIADQVQQLAPKDKAALVDRLQTHATTTQNIAQDAAHDITQNTRQDATQDTTPWSQRPTCPLLVNSLCSVYAVRPAVCRKAHSLDVKACEAGAPQIPQSLRVVVTAQARSQGTSDAFRDVGLVSSRHELASALLLALTDATAQSRWLAGDAVFAQAVAL